MTYYPTLAEDLTRAKEILAKGSGGKFSVELEKLGPELYARLTDLAGGTIYEADTYAAYKLLESFVAEIERLRAAYSPMTDDPFDHNGECKFCDEQAMHRADCPWLLQLIAEHARLAAVERERDDERRWAGYERGRAERAEADVAKKNAALAEIADEPVVTPAVTIARGALGWDQ
jgi:hypothetical protein